MPQPMIEIDNLTRNYGPAIALDRISLTVNQGEVMGFLGPNGAGKTTTMKILAGLLAPTLGAARVAGLDVMERPLEARARIGYLPETPPIHKEMTTREYLTFLAALRNVPARKRREAVERAMARCGLTEVSDRLLGNLSKGFRQRAGIAQAIVHGPDVVILDEPTVGLDPIQIREIRELIRELGGEHSVLLSTHILPEVRMTCSRAAVISQGRIVAEDTVDGLEASAHDAGALRIRLGNPPEGGLNQLPGVQEVRALEGEKAFMLIPAPGSDPLPELLRRAVDGAWDLREVAPAGRDLEEVFIQLAAGNGTENAEETS